MVALKDSPGYQDPLVAEDVHLLRLLDLIYRFVAWNSC